MHVWLTVSEWAVQFDEGKPVRITRMATSCSASVGAEEDGTMWTIARIEEASGGKWYCPPENQGQIVVVEYAYDQEHGSGDAFRRVVDRSEGPNGRPSYAYAELPPDRAEWPDAWTVPLHGEWRSVLD